MSKLEDTLRKDGWELTPCTELKPGDYVAVINSYSGEREGAITDVVDNKNGTFEVCYGELGMEVLPAKTGALWVAPKKYEHLEQLWGVNGDMYVNVSHTPHEPYFVPAVFVKPEHYKHIAPQTPDQLLKEKP